MKNLFKRYPLSTIIGYAVTALAVLTYLQAAHILHGPLARWVDLAAGILNVLLTAYARQHVTPLAAPKDAVGRKLVPARTQSIV